MPTRPQFSTAGRPQTSATRTQGARGARSAASGLPTTYHECQELTKAGALCRAKPVEGGRVCVGHQRRERANAEQV